MAVEALAFHPVADVFPLIAGAEFEALVADVAAHGLRVPIILHPDGRILDGRNRYRACAAAGVEPRFETWSGEGLACDFVWSLNGPRRHLTREQQQIAAGKWAIAREDEARNRQGDRTDLTSVSIDTEVDYGRSRQKAAEQFGQSEATVGRAVKVIKDGVPELVAAVERGDIAVSTAAEVAELPKAKQAEVVARGEIEILKAAKEIRAKKNEERRAGRVEKLAAIAVGNAELPTSVKYPIVYADPPWRYEHVETESRAIENQYPTMALEDICAMAVGSLTTDDAVLFLWATSPKLADAMRVVESWGFNYRTSMVWVKDRIGMGYYARQRHELLLICTKGQPPTPAPSDRPDSVVTASQAQHSAKPAAFYDVIERMYPTLPKIELFCRSPRDGWAVWGNQAVAS